MNAIVEEATWAEKERRLLRKIDGLKDDISELEDDLEEAEAELERLRRCKDQAADRRMRQVAREVLAMPFLSGAIWELALRVVEDGMEADGTEGLEAYHAARLREMNLAGGAQS